MRRLVGGGVLVVLAVLGLGGCSPSSLDVERRVAAEAYRIERGDRSAKPSEAQCEVKPYQETDSSAFVVTTCTVRGYRYELQANYSGPKGRRTAVDIRAYYGILPSPLVVKCGFTYNGQGWNLGSCKKGDAVPR